MLSTPDSLKGFSKQFIGRTREGVRELSTLASLEGFRKAVYRPHGGGGAGHRVCDPLVHGSLVGEVTGG